MWRSSWKGSAAISRVPSGRKRKASESGRAARTARRLAVNPLLKRTISAASRYPAAHNQELFNHLSKFSVNEFYFFLSLNQSQMRRRDEVISCDIQELEASLRQQEVVRGQETPAEEIARLKEASADDHINMDREVG